MPTKNGVIKELELYMDFIPDGATGQLLKDCYKLITKQGKEIKELKRPNKQVKSKKKS